METIKDKKEMELGKRDILRMSNRESNQLTRECLQTALIHLMSQKPFDKITVTELVKRSGVSRTAFYRNYASKEEILNELCNTFLDGLAASFSDSFFQKNPRQWYYMFFQTVTENATLFGLLLQAHVLNTPVFSTYSISKKLDHSVESAPHYEFLAWEGAFSTIVVHWFQDGMKESIDFMADFCARTLIYGSGYDRTELSQTPTPSPSLPSSMSHEPA